MENTEDFKNNIEIINILEKEENIPDEEKKSIILKNEKIFKAIQKRKENFINNNYEREEKIKKIVEEKFLKDLEKMQIKKEKLYKRLSKIL